MLWTKNSILKIINNLWIDKNIILNHVTCSYCIGNIVLWRVVILSKSLNSIFRISIMFKISVENEIHFLQIFTKLNLLLNNFSIYFRSFYIKMDVENLGVEVNMNDFDKMRRSRPLVKVLFHFCWDCFIFNFVFFLIDPFWFNSNRICHLIRWLKL